jgi:hypothetical protein
MIYEVLSRLGVFLLFFGKCCVRSNHVSHFTTLFPLIAAHAVFPLFGLGSWSLHEAVMFSFGI